MRDDAAAGGVGAPSLLDGATPHTPLLPAELAGLREAASDRSRGLDERLEAYEDIIDSEIGDTLLSRARNVEREHGVRQLYLKFEGGNPTGTQKDRIAFAQAMDALRRGFEGVTLATCGNYGSAMALASSLAGLECHVFIPEGYRTRRLAEMEGMGARIVRCGGDYESTVVESREHAERHGLYDANPGGANTQIQLRAYGEIAYEIYDELRDAPAAVAVPVSNGTTLAGVTRGFLSLHRRGKTSRMPLVIGGSSYGKNPIVHSFLKGTEGCSELSPERIRGTQVNEPLVNWRSIDGELALQAIRSTGGWATYASDRRMLALSRLLRDREGLNVLPASTAGLNALLSYHERRGLGSDRYVAILTGRKQ